MLQRIEVEAYHTTEIKLGNRSVVIFPSYFNFDLHVLLETPTQKHETTLVITKPVRFDGSLLKIRPDYDVNMDLWFIDPEDCQCPMYLLNGHDIVSASLNHHNACVFIPTRASSASLALKSQLVELTVKDVTGLVYSPNASIELGVPFFVNFRVGVPVYFQFDFDVGILVPSSTDACEYTKIQRFLHNNNDPMPPQPVCRDMTKPAFQLLYYSQVFCLLLGIVVLGLLRLRLR